VSEAVSACLNLHLRRSACYRLASPYPSPLSLGLSPHHGTVPSTAGTAEASTGPAGCSRRPIGSCCRASRLPSALLVTGWAATMAWARSRHWLRSTKRRAFSASSSATRSDRDHAIDRVCQTAIREKAEKFDAAFQHRIPASLAKPGIGNGTGQHADCGYKHVVNDAVYQIPDGSGVGVGAPQFGLRRTVLVGVTQRF
jgi:hypothetical protein